MSPNSISMNGVRSSYQPGDRISGEVVWTTDSPARAVEIRLFWFTSGIAPAQIGPVETKVIDRPPSYSTHRFEFVLPVGPWSFEGSLASLHWAIEAVLLPSRQNVRVVFEMSPEGRATALYQGSGETEEQPLV